MLKVFPLAVLTALAACNTAPKSAHEKEPQGGKSVKMYSWAAEEEREFLSGCVDSARVKLGEAAAFAQCKCILNQLKQTFPNMDSAAPALMDVKKVAAFVQKCK